MAHILPYITRLRSLGFRSCRLGALGLLESALRFGLQKTMDTVVLKVLYPSTQKVKQRKVRV